MVDPVWGCRQLAGAIGLPLQVDREYDVAVHNARQRL
jgi:hypothetical protein